MHLVEEIHKHVVESSALIFELSDARHLSLLQWCLLYLLYKHHESIELFELSSSASFQSLFLKTDCMSYDSFYTGNLIMVLYSFGESIFLDFYSKGISDHQDRDS